MKNKVTTRLGHVPQRKLSKSLCRSVYMNVNSNFFSPNWPRTGKPSDGPSWVHLNQGLLLLLFSDSVVSNFLQPHGLQHTRFLCPPPFPRVCSKFAQSLSIELMMPSNHLIHCPTPLLFLPSIFLSQHQDLFQWVNSLHQVAKALELQQQSFQRIFRVDFFMEYYSKVRKKKSYWYRQQLGGASKKLG